MAQFIIQTNFINRVLYATQVHAKYTIYQTIHMTFGEPYTQNYGNTQQLKLNIIIRPIAL